MKSAEILKASSTFFRTERANIQRVASSFAVPEIRPRPCCYQRRHEPVQDCFLGWRSVPITRAPKQPEMRAAAGGQAYMNLVECGYTRNATILLRDAAG